MDIITSGRLSGDKAGLHRILINLPVESDLSIHATADSRSRPHLQPALSGLGGATLAGSASIVFSPFSLFLALYVYDPCDAETKSFLPAEVQAGCIYIYALYAEQDEICGKRGEQFLNKLVHGTLVCPAFIKRSLEWTSRQSDSCLKNVSGFCLR